jgi:hypothetical protein
MPEKTHAGTTHRPNFTHEFCRGARKIEKGNPVRFAEIPDGTSNTLMTVIDAGRWPIRIR